MLGKLFDSASGLETREIPTAPVGFFRRSPAAREAAYQILPVLGLQLWNQGNQIGHSIGAEGSGVRDVKSPALSCPGNVGADDERVRIQNMQRNNGREARNQRAESERPSFPAQHCRGKPNKNQNK